jgi:hypothetical protein
LVAPFNGENLFSNISLGEATGSKLDADPKTSFNKLLARIAYQRTTFGFKNPKVAFQLSCRRERQGFRRQIEREDGLMARRSSGGALAISSGRQEKARSSVN